jgi:protein-arginine kinase activator protein McsA
MKNKKVFIWKTLPFFDLSLEYNINGSIKIIKLLKILKSDIKQKNFKKAILLVDKIIKLELGLE